MNEIILEKNINKQVFGIFSRKLKKLKEVL